MPYFKTTHGSEEIQLFYEDLGEGQPVIFIAGWPLGHQMWEYQLTPLREKGYRCIAYDRRGFGKSDQSLNSYSYDALAADLNDLIEHLDVEKVTLIGFSMGGGEVVRYLSKYGAGKINRIVLVSSIIPYMLQTADNPNGVPMEMFQKFEEQIRDDRPEFIKAFGKVFYGVDFLNHPASQSILDWTASLALAASQKAMLDCMESFATTDFRPELSKVNVPVLIIHGDSDKTVPIEATGKQAASLINGAVFKIYEGAPHGLFITEKKKLNEDLMDFIAS